MSLELEIVINEPFQAGLIKTLFQTKEDLKLASPESKFPFCAREWEATFAKNQENCSLLFKIQNQVIGHVSFLPNGEDLYLCYVILHQDYRGKKIAERMITQAEEFCRLNYTHFELLLNVDKKNARAKNLYHRLGYEIFSQEKDKFKMKKRLRP